MAAALFQPVAYDLVSVGERWERGTNLAVRVPFLDLRLWRAALAGPIPHRLAEELKRCSGWSYCRLLGDVGVIVQTVT